MTSFLTFQSAIVETLLAEEEIAQKVDELRNELAMCGIPNEDALKLVFHAPDVSLRLTPEGNDLMSMGYKSWTVKIVHNLTARQRLALVHNSRYPYFIKGDDFTTYDKMLGMKLLLAQGSFDRIEEVLFK